MSLRDKARKWIENGFTPAPSPLCSKRLVIKNLIQINQLLEDESPYIANERIKFLGKSGVTDDETERIFNFEDLDDTNSMIGQ